MPRLQIAITALAAFLSAYTGEQSSDSSMQGFIFGTAPSPCIYHAYPPSKSGIVCLTSSLYLTQ